VSGIVVDSAVRDVEELRASAPLRHQPQQAHQGLSGRINAPIACSGVAVRPGDLIVGDSDGVTVARGCSLLLGLPPPR
jgi:regulator of RNase E activity RraA